MKKLPERDKSAADRFRDMARELECDEDEATFRAKLAMIARQKPKGAPKPRSAKLDASRKGREG